MMYDAPRGCKRQVVLQPLHHENSYKSPFYWLFSLLLWDMSFVSLALLSPGFVPSDKTEDRVQSLTADCYFVFQI